MGAQAALVVLEVSVVEEEFEDLVGPLRHLLEEHQDLTDLLEMEVLEQYILNGL
jgi:hypothetical protein